MCNLSESVKTGGIEKGLEKGKILGLIEAYKNDKLPETEITVRLQKKFSLTESEIREYLKECV